MRSSKPALLLLLCLSACGQSGPLYLPGDPSEVQEVTGGSADQRDGDEEQRENAAVEE